MNPHIMDGEAVFTIDVHTNGVTSDEIETTLPETQRDKSRGCNCNCCRRCMWLYNPLPHDASMWQKCKYSFYCPPEGLMGYMITSLVAIGLLWATTWSILGDEALPGGIVFALLIMYIACNIGGVLFEIIKLPGLLGMLVTGFILRNVPMIDIAKDIDSQWSSTIRTIALVVILIRAGLGLDYEKLRRLSGAVIRLSLIPCFTEVATVAVMAFFFFGFSWDFAFMLGFVHAAVSPAVVVPSMLLLQERGLGTDKGIPTMLIAAGSLENVVAISGFSLTLGITFSSGSLAFNIARCPMEIVIGLVYGGVFGILTWYIPHSKHNRISILRFLFVLGGGLFATFGAKIASVPGAGALGCLILAFVAAHGWRKQRMEDDQVAPAVAVLWVIFQPLLFGLIGAEVKVQHLKADVIGIGAGILAAALFLRCVATFLSVFGTPLLHKEKSFVALSWIPKATVQAAIGSLALDTAKELKRDEETVERGTLILTIAVFVIVVTAPIGAALISLTAPRLLTNKQDDATPCDQTKGSNTSVQNINSKSKLNTEPQTRNTKL